ncbi:MAG: hypothetical protein IPK26_03935 [Planctomycetes bacterium]|nr:hypothetical protein [Planctomycetota bacterium]
MAQAEEQIERDPGDDVPLGIDAGRQFVMATYFTPLVDWTGAYLGLERDDAIELVTGFFADRLDDPGYLARWRLSRIPLRWWLWNGLQFFAKEQRRWWRRGAGACDVTLAEPGVEGGDVVREIDRQCAIGSVRAALRLAAAACKRDGFRQHWLVFLLCFLREHKQVHVANRMRISPARVRVMLRAARLRFVAALREVLRREGVPAWDVPRRVRALVA